MTGLAAKPRSSQKLRSNKPEENQDMNTFKKPTLFLAAAWSVLLVSGCSFISSESGGYLDPNTKLLEPDAAGRLEAAGDDLRIYEFTPQKAPYMQCVFVAGGRKGGTFCFEKKGN